VLHTTQAVVEPGFIDLSLGHPSPGLLPAELLRRASVRVLDREGSSGLQYGYEQGESRFRRRLAEFLSRAQGHRLREEQLFVSGGASQALDLACTLFASAGQAVLVEEPTYFLALRIFADHGLVVESLPTDGQGLIVEALEERLRGPRPAFLYVIPAYQNPSGTTLAEPRRRRLAELSRSHQLLVLADEVYQLLSYGEPPPLPLARFIEEAPILSLGSFSKILAPGLRLGWVAGSPERLRRFAECGLLDSGGGLAPFGSALARSLLEEDLLGAHVEHLRQVYGQRAQVLGGALKRHLGQRARFLEPRGGFFYWLTFPETVDTRVLLPRAQAERVRFLPGSRFSSSGALGNCLRLSLSYHAAEELEEGARRLGAALG
jgi:2-aminoadipate transaminase